MPLLTWTLFFIYVVCQYHYIWAAPVFGINLVDTADVKKPSMINLREKISKEDNERIQSALPIAQQQVAGMKKCTDNPNDPRCKKILEASFGKANQNYNLNKVKETVNKLDTQPIRVLKLPLDPDLSQYYGFTHLPEFMHKDSSDYKESPYSKNVVQLGPKFHTAGTYGWAGTLIHEATHYLTDTADAYDPNTKKFVSKNIDTGKNGYFDQNNMDHPPQSIEQVNANRAWANQRDEAKKQ